MGMARQTGHEWLHRYANDGGLSGLADRSSRPESCPHQMPAAVEARVVALRIEHPGWGPSRIGWQLGREAVEPLPGRSRKGQEPAGNYLLPSRPVAQDRLPARQFFTD